MIELIRRQKLQRREEKPAMPDTKAIIIKVKIVMDQAKNFNFELRT